MFTRKCNTVVRLGFLFFVLLWLTPLLGQDNELSSPELVFTAVIVEDLAISSKWYQDVLDFKLVNSTANQERGFKQANLANGYAWLELLEIKNSVANATTKSTFGDKARINGYFKIGFRVNTFENWLQRLTKLGVSYSGNVVTDPNTGKKMIIILDPDGNRIQIFEK